MRDVILLGSTGSIGTQAVDVIRRNPDRFRVVGLAAAGGRVELLAQQALELGVEVVAVARASAVQDLQLAFYAAASKQGYASGDFKVPKILGGPGSVARLAGWPDLAADGVVLNGMDGAQGLAPTLAALDAGHTLALANKESLIIGGPLVRERAGPGQIVPVDSEHSAIAQCLRGGHASEVRRLVVTASGGPFRGRSRDELAGVTVEDALAHPNFSMGRVITTNSATLVNKGLEVIEAHLLFDIPFERIEVVVHPQQMIHSMVEFVDGSTIAQAGPPRMLVPIALGLSWPERVPDVDDPCDWTRASSWEFEPLDGEAFPAVRLAREAGAAGGVAPAVFNAANEECVAAFLDGALPFLAIVDTVERVLSEQLREGARAAGDVSGVEEVLRADGAARQRARALIGLPPGTHHTEEVLAP